MDRTVAPGFTRIGSAVRSRLPGWPEDPPPGALVGRTAAVTGATSGLGLATAEGFARLGASVRLVVRDEEKGARSASASRSWCRARRSRSTGATSPTSTTYAASPTELDVDRLDVLVHNAGAMPATRTESPQGHELTMALHVLGPVLMTELLRPVLTGHDARVLLVTSGGMYGQAPARRRPGVPPRRLQPDHRLRAQQAGPGGAAARARAAGGRRRGIGVHATHPGLGRHPRRGRVAAHGSTGSPARCCATPRAARTPRSGSRPTAPQPRSGQLGTTVAPARRTCSAGPAPARPSGRRMWAWVREQTGLDELDRLRRSPRVPGVDTLPVWTVATRPRPNATTATGSS